MAAEVMLACLAHGAASASSSSVRKMSASGGRIGALRYSMAVTEFFSFSVAALLRAIRDEFRNTPLTVDESDRAVGGNRYGMNSDQAVGIGQGGRGLGAVQYSTVLHCKEGERVEQQLTGCRTAGAAAWP